MKTSYDTKQDRTCLRKPTDQAPHSFESSIHNHQSLRRSGLGVFSLWCLGSIRQYNTTRRGRLPTNLLLRPSRCYHLNRRDAPGNQVVGHILYDLICIARFVGYQNSKLLIKTPCLSRGPRRNLPVIDYRQCRFAILMVPCSHPTFISRLSI